MIMFIRPSSERIFNPMHYTDIIYGLRGIQVSVTPKFKLLTQLSKILEFRPADFQLIPKTINLRNLILYT